MAKSKYVPLLEITYFFRYIILPIFPSGLRKCMEIVWDPQKSMRRNQGGILWWSKQIMMMMMGNCVGIEVGYCDDSLGGVGFFKTSFLQQVCKWLVVQRNICTINTWRKNTKYLEFVMRKFYKFFKIKALENLKLLCLFY